MIVLVVAQYCATTLIYIVVHLINALVILPDLGT